MDQQRFFIQSLNVGCKLKYIYIYLTISIQIALVFVLGFKWFKGAWQGTQTLSEDDIKETDKMLKQTQRYKKLDDY